MRPMLVAFLGGCLLGLIAGCGGSGGVEMPAHPAPLPQNPSLVPEGGDFQIGGESGEASGPEATPGTPRRCFCPHEETLERCHCREKHGLPAVVMLEHHFRRLADGRRPNNPLC